jgi:threonine dehydratase
VIGLEDVRAAARRIEGRVLRTPSIPSSAVSQVTGADVTLKLENLQRIGSFKERGAANRLALLTEAERARGVIAMSAGNHAQAVARHASLLGVQATIVMPLFTPATKVSRTRAWGAEVVLHGEMLADAAQHAHALAERDGRVFVHPYDDEAVMAGQGTLALEFLEDAPEIEVLLIPVGGGGMIAGCAAAAAGVRPDVEVIGVEVESYATLQAALAGREGVTGGSTIAEGIAVQRIGDRCLEAIPSAIVDPPVTPSRPASAASSVA